MGSTSPTFGVLPLAALGAPAAVDVTVSIIVGIASTGVLTAALRQIARHRPARPKAVEQSSETDPRHVRVIVGGAAIDGGSGEGLLLGRLT